MRNKIRAAVAAIVLAAGAAIPVAGSAAPAGACAQFITETHGPTYATTHIHIRYCGRSYRSWAGFFNHGAVFGPWRKASGTTSTSYYAGGGNQGGGWQWERTGGTLKHTVRTY